MAWECAGLRAVKVVLCILLFCFVYSSYLYYCCYCSLLVHCSVKLPLFQLTRFAFFFLFSSLFP